MKFAKVLVISLLVFPLLSCSKKEKERLLVGEVPGTNGATGFGSVSVGKGGSSLGAPSLNRTIAQSPSSEIQRGRFTIQSIEFSTDETNWVTLTDTPFDVEVEATLGSTFNRFSIGPFSVPAGAYKGIRIKLAPGLTVLETLSGNPYGELNALPKIFVNRKEVGITDTIVYTYSNNRLVPFTIQSGGQSFLILGIYIVDPYQSEWRLEINTKVSDTP